MLPPDIGPIATEFLTKTLQSDINHRMSPEELEHFSFSTKYFIDLKTSMKLQSGHERTRSLMKSSRNLSIPRIDIQTPKASFAPPAIPSGQKSTRQDPINSSYRLAETDKTDRNTRKETSAQLLSEVHFCRYLYKLIGRLNESRLDGLESLKQQLSGLIHNKVTEILSLEHCNCYQIDNYREYRDTGDFRKIMNITRQYEEKYKELLDRYGGRGLREDYVTASQETVLAAKSLYGRLEFIQQDQFPEMREELILLDYLLTTYQLIELASLKDLTEFHRKSKIEAIVEGNPTRVGFGHLKAVREKMAKLQLI